MTKILAQLGITILLFFTVWFGLSRIDWMGNLKVEHHKDNLESSLGEMLEEQILNTKDTTLHPEIYLPVRDILNKICAANDVDSLDIKMHITEDSEINAFAMPGGIMVINKGLILESDSEEAMAGVIGHELAHITEKHVMRRLIREIGLSMLVNMTTGGSGAGASQVLKELTSSSYDRDMETEADLLAVTYLENANMNPEPFAEFMYFISTQIEMPAALQWISSHPESEARSKAILAARDEDKTDFEDHISDEDWENIKTQLANWY